MGKTTNAHNAPDSFLGFLFQIERVLLWLSEGGEGKIVGVETDDDIVVQLKRGEDINKIYEQAKNSQSKRIPFQDLSEDLWKTLSIWIKAVEDNKITLDNAIFSAITNKKIPEKRLIRRLSEANKNKPEELKKVVKELKETAAKLSENNKKYGDVVLKCDEKKLMVIIDKIILLDGSFHHNQKDFKTKLKANLSIGDKLPLDHIYNSLFGSIVNEVINCWRKGEEAWIPVDNFNNLYNNLVAEFLKKSFLEKATDYLPVEKKEVDANRKSTYVQQLKKINCEEYEILEAIHDYLRAQSEKSRYAKEFDVTEPKFISYYKDLKTRWDNISRPRFKINSKGLTPEQIGYEVYYETTSYKGRLNNQEPEQSYTYKGAFHHLANQPEIGWHPDWEKIFKK